MATSVPPLAAAARRVAQAPADPQARAALGPAFLAATVFAPAADRPGVLAPAGGPVPVCTSLEQLARYAGPVRWLSTTGEDLLRTLPPGTDLLLDPAGETPLRLNADAVARTLAVTTGRRG